MAEVGLTESYGDTGYKFEIWFRKRSKGESYILQAQSSDIRHHWVKEISHVLWNQAITNRGRLSFLETYDTFLRILNRN